MIALVIPDLSSPYYCDLAWAVSQEAWKHGYQLVVQQTGPLASGEHDALKSLRTPMCDGLIINLHNVHEDELSSLIGGHPAVLFEDYVDQPSYDNVSLPLEAAFRTAFEYLRQQGHTHVAIVGGKRFDAEEFGSIGRNVGTDLAMQAMIAAGLGDEADTVPCKWDVDGGMAAAATIVQADLGYDAFFCMNDLIAMGLTRGLQSMGMRVPKDKAVMGFDGVSPAFYTSPLLTTIALDFDGMAKSAVSMLVERIKAGQNGKDRNLAPRRQTAAFRLVRGETA